MTTYNTGNPIGSSCAKDLFDNAENLDVALNSNDDTFVDRLGKERPTLSGAVDPTGLVQTAVNARNEAVAARDAAIVNSEVFPDEATGRATVADGEYFKVIGSGDVAVREYQRVNGNTSTLVAEYPGSSAPTITPQELTAGQDLNDLPNGVFFIGSAATGNSLLNTPSDMSLKIGLVICYRRNNPAGSMPYQKFVRYTEDSGEIEFYERVSNGGGAAPLTWLPWQKGVSNKRFKDELSLIWKEKGSINLFKNLALTSEGAFLHQATNQYEGGYAVAVMDNTILSSIFYDYEVDAVYYPIGSSLVFSIDIMSDATSVDSGDISVSYLTSNKQQISISSSARATKINEWHRIGVNAVIPEGAAYFRVRLIRRPGNTYVKFRNPKLTSNGWAANYINPTPDTKPVIPAEQKAIVYVSKTGNDNNTGLDSEPYLTIQKAVDSLPNGGIIEVGGGEYREAVTVTTNSHIWLRSKRNERAIILGSDQLTASKTAGYTQVYQAPLASKPTGMGGARGKPVIFEWGTHSKPINENEHHFLHRGRTHRLPYAEMFEASSLAELDTPAGLGKWWWESGIIYFTATDGSDASLKRYEARKRKCLEQSNGSIQLTRIDAYFSSYAGMSFSGVSTKREDCRVYGAYQNGFSDNANFTESYRDEAGGNGNDGFNGTVTSYSDESDEKTRLEAVYFDPYGHDNGDDGISFHYRGSSTAYGGLFEYNTKADVVHVTGAACVCYNTEVRGTTMGFYSATSPSGDPTRLKTTFKCIGTKSTSNAYSYRAADDAVLHCDNVVSIDPSVCGYYQTGSGEINARNCKYTGEPEKSKSGTINVVTDNDLA